MHSNLPRSYGHATGPLGFPMPDRAARTLDTLLKTLPQRQRVRVPPGRRHRRRPPS